MSDTNTVPEMRHHARARSEKILDRQRERLVELPAKYLSQSAHLTVPATIWRYVENAVTKSDANLVMLDLEDSIPAGDEVKLVVGRANVVRALKELDWGTKLRFFRPRGTELDPGHEDVVHVVTEAGKELDGLVFPKVESPEEITSLDETLRQAESEGGIAEGSIKISILIESVDGEERAFEIARASKRIVSLVFGAFDYWSSLRMALVPYRFDHPSLDEARRRIVKAAASVGVPAIAEMTTNFPTKDKTEEERAAALAEFRLHAAHAKDLGFLGKWVGIPAQVELAREIFRPSEEEIEAAKKLVRAFADAEQRGLGAVMIDGHMADRATVRVARMVLEVAGGSRLG